MQTKLPDGSIMVCGGCSKDAELQIVGEKGSRKCSVGIAAGKRNEETVWVNVVAWHNLASILCAARKGDPVFVIGKLETREYNGKEYKDLVAEFVNVCSVSAVAANPAPMPAAGFEELADDDEVLPF